MADDFVFIGPENSKRRLGLVTLDGDENIKAVAAVVVGVGESAAGIEAWGPRVSLAATANGYQPGINQAVTYAEAYVAIPVAGSTMPAGAVVRSVSLWFVTTGSLDTMKGGGFMGWAAFGSGELGVLDANATDMAPHPPTTFEYPIPDGATHLVLAGAPGLSALGAWNYR